MCGETSTQDKLSDEETSAFETYLNQEEQQYSKQSSIYSTLTSELTSIFNKGANQQGYSAAELNNLNAQATEGTAENYSSAAKSQNESLAAEGGGNEAITTGGQTQLKEQTAESSAQEQSKEETSISEANYEQGYKEWENAESGLEAVATGENPTSYANAATSASESANSEADTIASEESSWESSAISAATAIGSTALYCWIAAELWGGWEDPRTIRVRHWLSTEFRARWYGPFVLAVYARWGELAAKAIREKRWLRWIFNVIFEKALRSAQRINDGRH